MTAKPSTSEGYGSEQLASVHRTCLYMAMKLGDLLDEIVVVGGLVPYLLVDQDNLPSGVAPHAGTMDLDLGLAVGVLDRERYRELALRLRDAGFEPEINDQGNPRFQTWVAELPDSVSVDFLIPPLKDTDRGGTLLHIEPDLAAIVTPGLELAFRDRVWKELTDAVPSGARAVREVPVCGAGAYIVLKSLAFGLRTANKDAYDLFYVLSGVGIPEVASRLGSLQPDPNVDEALNVMARDFSAHDRPGPVGAAHFQAHGPDDELQADVVGHALELLRVFGRP